MIAAARANFANSPFDPSSQARLKALLDLQGILQSRQLAPDELKLVREQVSSLAASTPNSSTHSPVPSMPVQPVPPVPVPVSTPPTQTPQSLQNLFNAGTLAELIKATANRQQPTPPPQIPNILPQMHPPQMPASSTPQPLAAAENPLIAALRARGLISSQSAPPTMPSSGTPPMGGGSLPFFIPGQSHSTPPVPTPPQAGTSSTVPMNTASMKM